MIGCDPACSPKSENRYSKLRTRPPWAILAATLGRPSRHRRLVDRPPDCLQRHARALGARRRRHPPPPGRFRGSAHASPALARLRARASRLAVAADRAPRRSALLRSSASSGGCSPRGSTAEPTGAPGDTSRSSCRSRSRPSERASSTPIRDTTRRRRSTPGATRIAAFGKHSPSAAAPSRSWPSPGPGKRWIGPDADASEEIARIEQTILQGAVRILDEFGGLQAAMKRSVALTKQARQQPGQGPIHRAAAPGKRCASPGRTSDDRPACHATSGS